MKKYVVMREVGSESYEPKFCHLSPAELEWSNNGYTYLHSVGLRDFMVYTAHDTYKEAEDAANLLRIQHKLQS